MEHDTIAEIGDILHKFEGHVIELKSALDGVEGRIDTAKREEMKLEKLGIDIDKKKKLLGEMSRIKAESAKLKKASDSLKEDNKKLRLENDNFQRLMKTPFGDALNRNRITEEENASLRTKLDEIVKIASASVGLVW